MKALFAKNLNMPLLYCFRGVPIYRHLALGGLNMVKGREQNLLGVGLASDNISPFWAMHHRVSLVTLRHNIDSILLSCSTGNNRLIKQIYGYTYSTRCLGLLNPMKKKQIVSIANIGNLHVIIMIL